MFNIIISRIYVERRFGETLEADSLYQELRNIHGLENLEKLRILNRYDIQGLDSEMLEKSKFAIFADPCTDILRENLPDDYDEIIAVEFLPGQFDQRADAAEQCAGLLFGFRPVIKTAKIYLLYGKNLDTNAFRKFIINPVEAREANLENYASLETNYPIPENIKTIKNFRNFDDEALAKFLHERGLAMNLEDLKCCREFFRGESREPTMTEIKVLDTYWSDHCRHTTFLTQIDHAEILDSSVKASFENYLEVKRELKQEQEQEQESEKPVTLMEIATIAAKYLRKKNLLPDLVDSEENNACTVRIKIHDEPWLLLFKNETHNHPTEIEPFGGAATCIGGAIRDPLSGRAYVYQAMRITGAANPYEKPMPGKLSQKSITTKAAAGYSSYGNQIGIPTGLVDEIYHEGYAAKRLEVGAVIAAAPEKNVIREKPKSGDLILLLGGKTGRDGIGGATGSSVSHTSSSIETCGAEVQKGNAPEERKLQRLFRNANFTQLVKKCNDFGAGGVSVAVGELADGLEINLDSVPLKYAGLDGTEIAVSESQERMAIVIAPENLEAVKNIAESEDVQASVIARVNDSGRMKMFWRGIEIVNLSREFINSNGAKRHVNVSVKNFSGKHKPEIANHESFAENLRRVLSDLNVASKRGLCERFDSTVGAGSVLMPFGGKLQLTPSQAMAAKIPVLNRDHDICSVMSWGFDPYISELSPFNGAYLAVVESLAKLAATGADLRKCWLTFQEYFGKPENDPDRWGLPFSALLGAFQAQLDFEVAAIGGKDSMSGTFKTYDGKILDVPPTLISFAVSLGDAGKIISPEFKNSGSKIVLLSPKYSRENPELPEKDSMREILSQVQELIHSGKVISAATPCFGGIAAMIFKMCLGNNLGFSFSCDSNLDLFGNRRGEFLLELSDPALELGVEIGRVISEPEIVFANERVKLEDLSRVYDSVLEKIFPVKAPAENSITIPVIANTNTNTNAMPKIAIHNTKPRFLIPVFNGTNCEYETARAVENSGGEAEIFVVRTLTPDAMKISVEKFAQSLNESQAMILPGGFSNGDEPDGSGKFIAIFLRSPVIREAVKNLLDSRGGLICGICNGFQALVKTGLLPYGRIVSPDELSEDSATLTFNRIARHQSRIVRVKIITNNSPWLRMTELGKIYSVAISHGEGRFKCGEKILRELFTNSQVAAQYVNLDGEISMDELYNPNGSIAGIECVTSPDGRILGRMGHAERIASNLYRNVGGIYDMKMFESAVKFFAKNS